jgi:hypothetical protein
MTTTPSEPFQDPDIMPIDPDMNPDDPGPAPIEPDVVPGPDADPGSDPKTKVQRLELSPELLS